MLVSAVGKQDSICRWTLEIDQCQDQRLVVPSIPRVQSTVVLPVHALREKVS